MKPRFGTANFARRKNPRYSVDLPAESWTINDLEIHRGHAVDINEGGVLLFTY